MMISMDKSGLDSTTRAGQKQWSHTPIDIGNLYTFHTNNTSYLRKDRPEQWEQVKNGNGQMYRGYPFCSRIPLSTDTVEPMRYGDFLIDIDTEEVACSDARNVILWFEQVFGVDPEQWRIYLSGKKGVHLELAASILGTDEGHRYLPLAYKRLATEVQNEAGVVIDLSLYNMGTGKPYRQPNVMRDTGTCKRQITYDHLCEITDEQEYRSACSEPGDVWRVEDESLNFQLAGKMAQYLGEAAEQSNRIKNQPALSEEEKEILSHNLPDCVAKWSRQQGKVGKNLFNDVLIQLTCYAVCVGMGEDEFTDQFRTIIRYYPSTSLKTDNDRLSNCRNRYRTILSYGYQFSCGGMHSLKGLEYDCSSCPLKIQQAKEDFEEIEQVEVQETKNKLDIGSFTMKRSYTDKLGHERFYYDNLLIKNHILTVIAISGGGKTAFFFREVIPHLTRQNLKVWYLDADSPTSDHPWMLDWAEQHGFLVLNADANENTSVSDMIKFLEQSLADNYDFSGHILIFDTLKKFCDMMSKGSLKKMFALARRLTRRGATIVFLAHANKQQVGDDKPLTYEGTGDVRSDTDELIYLYTTPSEWGRVDVTTVVDPEKGAKTRGLFKPFSFNIGNDRTITMYDEPIDLESRVNKASDYDILERAKEYIREQGEPVLQRDLVSYIRNKTKAGRDRIRDLLIANSAPKEAPAKNWKMFHTTKGERKTVYYELSGKR